MNQTNKQSRKAARRVPRVGYPTRTANTACTSQRAQQMMRVQRTSYESGRHPEYHGSDSLGYDTTVQHGWHRWRDDHEEDLDRTNQLLKDRAGYYFYIDVWNCRAQLHIMHTLETGSAIPESVEIDIPDEMIMEAIYE